MCLSMMYFVSSLYIESEFFDGHLAIWTYFLSLKKWLNVYVYLAIYLVVLCLAMVVEAHAYHARPEFLSEIM